MSESLRLRRTIRRNYSIALLAIGAVVLASVLVSKAITTAQENDATVINIAGMQRMLSQKISLYAVRLNNTEDAAESKSYAQTLHEAIDRFEQNHIFLVGSNSSGQVYSDLPAAIASLYFDGGNSESLHGRVLRFIEAAKIVEGGKRGKISDNDFSIGFTERLLRDLDRVVSAFEQQASERVKLLELVLWGLLVMALLVLLLEFRFIFMPMERLVVEGLEQLEKRRQQAVDLEQKANLASQAKSKFLAAMSHELRTPMNGMFGLIELAQNENHINRRNRYLSQALNSGKHLLRLVNDILDIAKIESGQLELSSNDFSLISILDQVTAPCAVTCQRKGLEFNYKVEGDIPNCVNGDATRILQILNNLLSNAVKFTQAGSVDMCVKINEVKSGYSLDIEITDTGIGISTAAQQSIFDRFTQEDDRAVRAYDGAGLGLAITHDLLAAMGGSIGVTSIEGKGSRFFVKIPLQKAKDENIVEEQKRAGNIAVVDDLESSRRYLELVISQLGYKVACFADGNALISCLQKGEIFDLVLLDLNMPYENGADLGVRLHKGYKVSCKHLALITAGDESSLSDTSGMTCFWRKYTKPLSLEVFQKDLEQLLSETSSNVSLGYSILLAEDNDINALVVEEMLKGEGVAVERVVNGKQAVEKAKTKSFDLILMDINMPIMDGLEAAEIISRQMQLPIPIVALTANAYDEDEQASLRAGMVGHLTKPIDKAKMLRTIHRVLAQSH